MNKPPPINPRAYRTSVGHTQSQAAAIIGATLRTWQEWEGGRRNMPPAKFALYVMLTQPPAATPAQPQS